MSRSGHPYQSGIEQNLEVVVSTGNEIDRRLIERHLGASAVRGAALCARGLTGWVALLLLVIGCARARADSAPPPRLIPPVGVDLAPGAVELSLVLSDPSSAQRCRPDQYRWPGCDAYPPRGYVNEYRADDPLEYEFAPAGTYDLTLSLRLGNSPAALLSVTRRGVRIGPVARIVIFDPSAGARRGPRLRVRVKARPAGRVDHGLCEARGSYSSRCTSEEAEVRCWVDTADGQHHEASSCKEEYVYRSLLSTLCERGVHMKESEYARRFQCAPAAPHRP